MNKPHISGKCISNALWMSAILWILLIGGCTLIWSDDILIVDALKDRNIDDFYMHRDPNGYMIQGKKYKSKPDPESIRATGEAVGAGVGTAGKTLIGL